MEVIRGLALFEDYVGYFGSKQGKQSFMVQSKNVESNLEEETCAKRGVCICEDLQILLFA